MKYLVDASNEDKKNGVFPSKHNSAGSRARAKEGEKSSGRS